MCNNSISRWWSCSAVKRIDSFVSSFGSEFATLALCCPPSCPLRKGSARHASATAPPIHRVHFAFALFFTIFSLLRLSASYPRIAVNVNACFALHQVQFLASSHQLGVVSSTTNFEFRTAGLNFSL
jgi:hypothetical protein